MSTQLNCWRCGKPLDQVGNPVSRRDECRGCSAEVHCCRMCVSWDANVATKCREDRAEPPTDKERANFCDWFKPSPSAYQGQAVEDAEALRAQVQDLFKSGD